MSVSLKQRLLWILIGLITFIWVISAFLLYLSSGKALEQQVDSQLRDYAHIVTYIARVYARQIDEALPLYETWSDQPLEELRRSPMIIEAPAEGEARLAVNVWQASNMIAMVAGSPFFSRPETQGLSYLDAPGGGRWRALTTYDEISEVWIRVAVEFAPARRALVGTLAQAMLPLLVVLPLTLGVLYFGVTGGLVPLNRLARQIARRSPSQLDPVSTEDIPAEMREVVDSLNTLMERLAFALEGEQRFTANAAHELMTPLAAIKAEVQLCQRRLQGAKGEESAERAEGADMLRPIAARVDRATHTVEQLLTLARVEPGAQVPRTDVAIRALLQEVLAETGHLAAERDLSVALEEGPEIVVEGNAEALAILMRNLLINAFRYATEHTEVVVGLSDQGGVELSVSNDCPPLSEGEFRQVAERFYRVPGQGAPGAGLGLSIVRRIAELHDAHMMTGPRDAMGGFVARVRFRDNHPQRV